MKLFRVLLKQSWFLSFLTVLGTVILFSLVGISVINFNSAHIEMKTIKNIGENNIYQISDSLINEKENEFFSSLSGYDKLYSFVNRMMSEDRFVYYKENWQPVYIADFKGGEIFDPLYQYGDSTPVTQMNGKEYSAVQALHIGNEVFKVNNVKLEDGRLFNKEEYIFHDDTEYLPILIGQKYKGIYNINDIVHINLYNKLLKGKVIGILQSDQKILTADQPEVVLDNYMVLPSYVFDVPPSQLLEKDPTNELFVRASLLSRTNNLILGKQSPLEIRKLMKEVSNDTDFFDYAIIGADNLGVDALVGMTSINKVVVMVATVGFIFITFSSFILIMIKKIRKNLNTYLVFLISGADISYIKKIVTLELLLIGTIGIFIPIIPLITVLNESSIIFTYYLYFSLIYLLILYLISKIFINKLLRQVNIVQHLKG